MSNRHVVPYCTNTKHTDAGANESSCYRFAGVPYNRQEFPVWPGKPCNLQAERAPLTFAACIDPELQMPEGPGSRS